jgi:hypothetical protein
MAGYPFSESDFAKRNFVEIEPNVTKYLDQMGGGGEKDLPFEIDEGVQKYLKQMGGAVTGTGSATADTESLDLLRTSSTGSSSSSSDESGMGMGSIISSVCCCICTLVCAVIAYSIIMGQITSKVCEPNKVGGASKVLVFLFSFFCWCPALCMMAVLSTIPNCTAGMVVPAFIG